MADAQKTDVTEFWNCNSCERVYSSFLAAEDCICD